MEAVDITHPESPDLAFLYGIMITDDDDDDTSLPGSTHSHVCLFADNEVMHVLIYSDNGRITSDNVPSCIILGYGATYIWLSLKLRPPEQLLLCKPLMVLYFAIGFLIP